jgi:hypothetical protein
MATSKPAPAQADATSAAAEPVAVDETPKVSFWRYIGQVARIYMHIPVTVEHGDVIAHPGEPAADGHWEAHPGPVTREPDNAPKPPPAATGDDTTTAQE